MGIKKLYFVATKEQARNIEGLAYYIADKSYIIERYGSNDPELKQCHDTILMLFDILDSLGVPFWVQNTVICYSENWKRYKRNYFNAAMKEKNIIL